MHWMIPIVRAVIKIVLIPKYAKGFLQTARNEETSIIKRKTMKVGESTKKTKTLIPNRILNFVNGCRVCSIVFAGV